MEPPPEDDECWWCDKDAEICANESSVRAQRLLAGEDVLVECGDVGDAPAGGVGRPEDVSERVPTLSACTFAVPSGGTGRFALPPPAELVNELASSLAVSGGAWLCRFATRPFRRRFSSLNSFVSFLAAVRFRFCFVISSYTRHAIQYNRKRSRLGAIGAKEF